MLREYSFYYFQRNFGIQANLFEYFYLRYGRENQQGIKFDFNSKAYSVNRFGLGVEYPVCPVLNSK